MKMRLLQSFKVISPLWVMAVIGAFPFWSQCQPRQFRLPTEVQEASGLYIEDEEHFWWINDSGDGPFLYRTDTSRVLRERIEIPHAFNKDWEDITHDDQGRIYIGDFGNNYHARQNLRIYIWDPQTHHTDSILFNYQDQCDFPPAYRRRNFNMEAFFWHNDSLHLFSKPDQRYKPLATKHYVLPAQPGKYAAVLRDTLDTPHRVVTGAAISPDGQTVALVAYKFTLQWGFIPTSRTTVYLLQDFPAGHFLKGKVSKLPLRSTGKGPTQYEAIDFFDDETLYLGSERTLMYWQQVRRMYIKKYKVKPTRSPEK
ncbi:MAG: hypothetical protein AAFQ83_21510 [Bacteroidota bacterium]